MWGAPHERQLLGFRLIPIVSVPVYCVTVTRSIHIRMKPTKTHCSFAIIVFIRILWRIQNNTIQYAQFKLKHFIKLYYTFSVPSIELDCALRTPYAKRHTRTTFQRESMTASRETIYTHTHTLVRVSNIHLYCDEWRYTQVDRQCTRCDVNIYKHSASREAMRRMSVNETEGWSERNNF